MGLVDIPGGFCFPDPRYWQFMVGAVGEQSTLLDASGEKHAAIFRVKRAGTIDRIGFRTRAVTTAQTLRLGLETVDMTTGFPTGTQFGGSAVGTQASPATDTFYEVTLGTGATVAVDDLVAIVVQFDATAGNLNICNYDLISGSDYSGIPYTAEYVGTPAWAKKTSSPAHSVRYSDGVYAADGFAPFQVPTLLTYNSGSTPDEVGNYFTLPVPMRCVGAKIMTDWDGPTDVVLYASDGTTVLRSASLDPDTRKVTGGGDAYVYWAPLELTAGTGYRITFKPTSTTNINVRQLPVMTAGMLNHLPGGTLWHRTSRTDAGAWTEDTTKRISMTTLIIGQLHDGSVLPRTRVLRTPVY